MHMHTCSDGDTVHYFIWNPKNILPEAEINMDTSTQSVGHTFSTLTIQNTSNSYTLDDNILAHHPNYSMPSSKSDI